MCNASLVASGSLAAMTAGTMTSAFGAYGEAKAQRQALEYQAAVDRNNAELMRWAAADATQRGEKAVQTHQLDTAALKGRQRAVFASRGVDLGEGSPARILSDTEFLGALDNQTIRRNAAREAYGYTTKATQYENDAAGAAYGARNIHPALAGVTSLLDGASTVASRWYSFKQVGALGG